MYTRAWATSERQYGVTVDRDVRVRMPDGTTLDGDVWRPAASGRFPVLLGAHPYNKDLQSPPMTPVGFTPLRGYMESGDPTFYARRGYAHAVFNLRGTGASEGFFQFGGPLEVEDTRHLIEHLAERPWSDGNVGMFGVSYFAMHAKAVAANAPAPLKAIFAPFSVNDWYRYVWYKGGVLLHGFLAHWARGSLHRLRYRSFTKEAMGDEAYREALADLGRDAELAMIPALREALAAPDVPANALVIDVLLHPFRDAFWEERTGGPGAIPAYLGACWGNYGLHLPGAFTAWREWRGPKKLVVGPPVYLDRPLYQYQDESLRWFDHWLKGIDTGVMDDPPVRVFIPPTGEWKAMDDWPPPEARWTTFFLHADGVLSEHELWPDEGLDSFNESAFEHGALVYRTPPFVEHTEVLGPSVAVLHVSVSDTDALLFLTLLAVDRDGTETELTRGWLRASQRALDEKASLPWEPVQVHTRREPLTPGEVYELRIPIVATARLFRAGERLALRIKGADDESPTNALEAIARNHLRRPRPLRITVHHDEQRASRIELPITTGNLLGTFFSGGDISKFGLAG